MRFFLSLTRAYTIKIIKRIDAKKWGIKGDKKGNKARQREKKKIFKNNVKILDISLTFLYNK